jgi:hypothetical protein
MRVRVSLYRSKDGTLNAGIRAEDIGFVNDVHSEMFPRDIEQAEAFTDEIARAALDYANTTLFAEAIPTTVTIEVSASVIKE